MPERNKREDEDARDKYIPRPSERNVDVPIRALSTCENRSLVVQLPDNPEIIAPVPAFPKTER